MPVSIRPVDGTWYRRSVAEKGWGGGGGVVDMLAEESHADELFALLQFACGGDRGAHDG